jgi:hypothetical protein
VALVDGVAAGCDTDCGQLALNARLVVDAKGQLTLDSHAPRLERLVLLTTGADPVRIAATRPLQILADAPLEVLEGRVLTESDIEGLCVQPEDGWIRVVRSLQS